MKHGVENRLMPIFREGKYMGCIQPSLIGFNVFDQTGRNVGSFRSVDKAMARLRASARST